MTASKTFGARESAAWLDARGLASPPHWYVEITLDSDDADTRIELNVYPEEWGFVFRRGMRVSSIRVTDIPFVHGTDDHRLLAQTPALDGFGALLESLERRYAIVFRRSHPTVRSEIARASEAVRRWLEAPR